MNPWNAKRRAALFLKQFYSTGFLSYVHGLACVVDQGCAGAIQAAHAHSRGAGGTYTDAETGDPKIVQALAKMDAPAWQGKA